ncbi:Guanylate-binding protein 6 [Stylophora pistillata]|uniref:Guanylate-binding protein 6 n=1 Tax=Stylophora pistillata TaxID=50429 RepID=A0A2B4RED8_STYPI|nr:Guanylate-binding protein 6 [Stylophora pistillata]
MGKSWRQQYQIEDEDEALAKALELSSLEQQGSQGPQRRSTVEPCQTEFKRPAEASGPDFKRKTRSQAGSRRATPLCLPNNCKWDSSSGECIQTGERRTSLYVLDEALENLRRIRGQEFTVVLLDSEGIDAANGQGLDDNQIFTLTVLLASVLIYNSQGVPTRHDLEGLEDVTQAIPTDCSNIKDYFLKKVFKVQDSSAIGQKSQKVAESILSFFPGFEAFALPSPTVDPDALKSINDNKHLMNPLFISGLEDFKRVVGRILLPKNSVNDGELVTGEGLAALVQLYVQSINTPGMVPNVQNAWDQFVETKCADAMKDALNAYRATMVLQLKDKLPCDNDRLRTGHALALENSEAHFMTDTKRISTNTIERFLKNLKESLNESFHLWQEENAKMTREFCNNLLKMLKKKHLDPVLQQLRRKEGVNLSFHEIIGKYNLIKDDYHTSAIGANDEIEAVFFEFHPEFENLRRFQWENEDEALAKALEMSQLKDSPTSSSLLLPSCEDLQQGLQMQNEDEDQTLAKAMALSLETTGLTLQLARNFVAPYLCTLREMEILSERQKEDRENFREQMDNDLRAHREQMDNMKEANMQQAQKEREQFMQENQELRNQFLDMQKMNEENIKMIKKLSDLVERQQEEKKRLEEETQRTQATMENKEMLEQMEAKHKEEKERLRRDMEAKIEKQRQALTKEFKEAANSRIQRMDEMKQKLEEVEEELKELKKPGFMERVKDFAVAGVRKNSNGQELTVVLLDSEGIDATNTENTDDHQIFTLTVLLASVLIYNSQGVPTRSDVEKLEYP